MSTSSFARGAQDQGRSMEEVFRSWVKRAQEVFQSKQKQYGDAWQWLRPLGLLDHLFIKARRLYNLGNCPGQVAESPVETWLGILNYAIMGLMRLNQWSWEEAVHHVFTTYQKKNHDYGEAWREMHPTSFVDIVLMRVARARHFLAPEQNSWSALRESSQLSALLQDQLTDIANYALFALAHPSGYFMRSIEKDFAPPSKPSPDSKVS